VPFIVAVNSFPDGPHYAVEELRTALDLSEDIPIVECDVRRRASSRDVLMTLMRFLYSLEMTKTSV
jgi:signal recognition particle receptor subunit beta